MQKREKIIVIMAVIAAIYGAVDFTMNRQQKKTVIVAPPTGTDSQTTGELTAQLSVFASANHQKIDHLSALLNEPWPEKSFALRATPFSSKKEVDESTGADLHKLSDQASQLVYSGFLAMGADRIAIINDMDYRVGEQINGFTITKINQEAVQVSQRDATFDIPVTTEQAPALPVGQNDTLDHNQPKASP